jgi:hypothetical protein
VEDAGLARPELGDVVGTLAQLGGQRAHVVGSLGVGSLRHRPLSKASRATAMARSMSDSIASGTLK